MLFSAFWLGCRRGAVAALFLPVGRSMGRQYLCGYRLPALHVYAICESELTGSKITTMRSVRAAAAAVVSST